MVLKQPAIALNDDSSFFEAMRRGGPKLGAMADDSFLTNHHGEVRKVQLSGRSYLHFRCRNCQRDFATEAETPAWKAAHIGIFCFNFLDELTTRQWISEKCPGQPLLAEVNDLRRSRVFDRWTETPLNKGPIPPPQILARSS